MQKYDALKLEYDLVKQELDGIREKYKSANSCESSLKTMKVNFDSVMLTAQNEIDRLKRQNDVIRKEKDDVLFRRARPKNVPVNTRDFCTQTDLVRKLNCGVQTDDVDASRKREVKVTNEHRGDGRKREESDRGKRMRSRSRERSKKSSRSSSKQSGSENERKRGKYDVNDNKRDQSRPMRDRRRPGERDEREIAQSRRIATRKQTRISEERIEDKDETQTRTARTRRSSERRKSQEKLTLIEEIVRLEKEIETKKKRKPKTPKKSLKQDVDPVVQELESIMSGNQSEKGSATLLAASKVSNEESGKGSKSKSKPVSIDKEQKEESVQDLRVLLESRKSCGTKSGPEGDEVASSSEEKIKPLPVPTAVRAKEKLVSNDVKKMEKTPVRPLELLW